ncbi:hypothetical protein BGZ67_000531 [Mortierella alpina]|nr:hypothetical protein BGZ67_000531 [Mortierella alpina]
MAVLTRDSDLVFHRPVRNVLFPRKGGLELLSRDQVLKAFEVDEDQLQLLAVVSTSDYQKAKRGYELVRNQKTIKGITTPPGPDRLRRMFTAYCNKVGCPDLTAAAWTIFVERQEHLVGENATEESSERHDDHANLIKRMWRARDKYLARRPSVYDTGDSQDEFWGDLSDDTLAELLDSLEVANPSSNPNPMLNDAPSKPKRKQTDWHNLECHCDMVTAELGSLKYLLKRNLGPRIRDSLEQHVARVQSTVMELSERTKRAVAESAKKEIDTAKTQYNQAIKELEVFGSIDPSAKTSMEPAYTQYYYQLVMHMESGHSEIRDELILAQDQLQTAVKQMRDGQVTNVVEATVQHRQGLVKDMSDRYQWTHLVLCLFVAATIWGPATESAEEKQERDEDLLALLDPQRSLSTAFWTGKFLVGEVMDTTKQPRNTMIDRSRVVRIAQTAAQLLRDCCPGWYLSPVPAGHSAIMLQVSRTLSNNFAEFFTTSLSALQTEMEVDDEQLEGNNAITQFIKLNERRPESERWSFFAPVSMADRFVQMTRESLRQVLTSSSSPVRCTMTKIFSTTEDMVFSLFYEQTRYVRSTMPMQDFAEDKGGIKLYLQQKWRDTKGRMYVLRTELYMCMQSPGLSGNDVGTSAMSPAAPSPPMG